MNQQSFSKIGEDNYVVVFRSLLSENSKGYPQMAERMKKLVSQQEGFLEFSSAREGVLGITVSYWKNLAAIKKWKERTFRTSCSSKKLGYKPLIMLEEIGADFQPLSH